MKFKKYILWTLAVMLAVIVVLSALVVAKYQSMESSATIKPEMPQDVEPTPDFNYIRHASPFSYGIVNFYENVDGDRVRYTYEEMLSDLALFEWHYGDFIEVFDIGVSEDGRQIKALRLGGESAPRSIVVQAGIHGREYMSVMLVMRQLEFYLDNYKNGIYEGRKYEDLFSEVAFYVIPMANPDGIALAAEGISAINSEELRAEIEKIYENDKKRGYATLSDGQILTLDEYLASWKANARGVDLNRNYDALWDEYVGEKAPCFLNYKGESALSESETRACTHFVESIPSVVASIAIHSRGNIIFWDCGQDGDLWGRTLELAKFVSGINEYKISYKEIRDASFTDHMALNRGVPTLTIEIGEGDGSSILPMSKFEPIWNENHLLWLALAKKYSQQ